MRFRIWGLAAAVFGAVLLTQLGASPATFADGASPVMRRASLPMLSTDVGSPLMACDPDQPGPGFSVANVQRASLPGFQGTIVQGDAINHCSAIASDVSMVALFFDQAGAYLGRASFHTDFGLIQPGAGSPFLVIAPLDSAQVGEVVIEAVRFEPVTASAAVLEFKPGRPSSLAGGVNVPYTVRNGGSANASLPRIAGRLIGPGCTAPFVIDFLQDGSPIAPGGTVTGSLFIPDTCGGAPELAAGSDAPLPSGLPPGLSFASVRAFYTPDDVLHLLANVSNNSAQDAFLPQFRVRFSGGTNPTYSLSETGIYSGHSCAPLLAAIPEAPAGLSFDRVISASALTGAQVRAEPPRRDPQESIYDKKTARINKDCTAEEIKALLVSSKRPGVLCRAALYDLYGAWGPIKAPEYLLTDIRKIPYPDEAALAVVESPLILSFAYNNTNSPLPSSAYRVQTLGYGRDGSLVAGIDISSPPTLPARGWGISITPLDASSVISLEGEEFLMDGVGFAIPK